MSEENVVRRSITHWFAVGYMEVIVTVAIDDGGLPCGLFIIAGEEGSTISGLLRALGVAVSSALQHGVPLPFFVDQFVGSRFEPNGWSSNSEHPFAVSIIDYVFWWLSEKFLATNQQNKSPCIH